MFYERKPAMKRLFALILTLALILALAVPALAADVRLSAQKLTVDGASADCEVYNIGGYNYFKLRDIAWLLRNTPSRFSVGWDEKTKTVSVATGAAYVPAGGELAKGADKSAVAVPSAQRLLIDGAESAMQAYNIGGNNFFQLRELGKALGFGVDYDAQTATMLVTSRAAQAAAGTARLPLTADAGRDYLDRIVFLGDSTTYGLIYYYGKGYSALPKPEKVWTPKEGYLTLAYYQSAKIYDRAVGDELGIAEAAARTKPEIMVITLGVDGISFMGEEDFVSTYRQLIADIRAASPDTKLILNSIYPVANSYRYQKDINNDKINAANGWIEGLAEELGLPFLYSWECLAENGVLPETAHNGDGLHLTGESFEKVVTYIRTHALT